MELNKLITYYNIFLISEKNTIMKKIKKNINDITILIKNTSIINRRDRNTVLV